MLGGLRRSLARFLCVSVTLWFVLTGRPSLQAQGRGAAPPAPRAAAPVDFTGNWVSIVSEDWRWRMITPPRGDYANIPLNAAARKIADTWDPARDRAAGEQCRGYAAPAIMREPTRLRISWQDDYTLKIETDAGTQTRQFHFARPEAAPAPPKTASLEERSWQGFSVARWEPPPTGTAGRGLPIGLGPRAGTGGRSLEVVTTQIRPGYLRKNGVPFSGNAAVTEYYDLFPEPEGPNWFVVTTIVRDSQFLGEPWITTSHFRREPDGSKWNPQPCQAQ
jgi:hypothetical protein